MILAGRVTGRLCGPCEDELSQTWTIRDTDLTRTERGYLGGSEMSLLWKLHFGWIATLGTWRIGEGIEV